MLQASAQTETKLWQLPASACSTPTALLVDTHRTPCAARHMKLPVQFWGIPLYNRPPMTLFT